LKYRVATAKPPRPQAATIRTSVQWKLVPKKPACMPLAKCLIGNIRAIHRIQDGELSPSGMKIPDSCSPTTEEQSLVEIREANR
jgi:hypothetical protein